MSKNKPEAGDIWIDKDKQVVYIVKCYENKSCNGDLYSRSYKIIEFSKMLDNLNVMECFEDHLVEYVGVSAFKPKDLLKLIEKKLI